MWFPISVLMKLSGKQFSGMFSVRWDKLPTSSLSSRPKISQQPPDGSSRDPKPFKAFPPADLSSGATSRFKIFRLDISTSTRRTGTIKKRPRADVHGSLTRNYDDSGDCWALYSSATMRLGASQQPQWKSLTQTFTFSTGWDLMT